MVSKRVADLIEDVEELFGYCETHSSYFVEKWDLSKNRDRIIVALRELDTTERRE